MLKIHLRGLSSKNLVKVLSYRVFVSFFAIALFSMAPNTIKVQCNKATIYFFHSTFLSLPISPMVYIYIMTALDRGNLMITVILKRKNYTHSYMK